MFENYKRSVTKRMKFRLFVLYEYLSKHKINEKYIPSNYHLNFFFSNY